jgi:hypothetical protein
MNRMLRFKKKWLMLSKKQQQQQKSQQIVYSLIPNHFLSRSSDAVSLPHTEQGRKQRGKYLAHCGQRLVDFRSSNR